MKQKMGHNKDAVIIDGYPADWGQDIPYHGVVRRKAEKCYAVVISAGGKQLYITTTFDQRLAAEFYDLALWKLLPKIDRTPKPNFLDSFRDITQKTIDDRLPRLNEVYVSVPFLSAADEDGCADNDGYEDILRDRNKGLNNGSNKISRDAALYRDAVRALRRYDVTLQDVKRKLGESFERLDRVKRKMPAQWGRVEALLVALDANAVEMNLLAREMDGQESYHLKLISAE